MSEPSLELSSPGVAPQLLLSVLAALPDTAVVVVDHGLVVRFVGGHGFDPEALVGRPLDEALGDRYEPHYRAALAGGTSTLETTDARVPTVERAEFLPLRLTGDAVDGAIAVIRHVANVTDVVSRHALDTTYRSVSATITALAGWAPDELIGRVALDLVHPADREATSAALTSLGDDAAPCTVRYRMAHQEGHWVWVETVARQLPDGAGAAELHASSRDISAQVAAQTAERDAQERFRLAFDDAPIGMALVDLDGRFTRVNTALCELLERSAEELLATSFQAITVPEDLDLDLDHLRRLTVGEIPRYGLEKRYLAPDGGHIWTQLSVSLLRDADGEPVGYIAQIQDIGDHKRMQDALRHLADHDMLSGLWNRRRFEEELRREIARARRHTTALALLLFDLDGLKRVNDTHGHQRGDELIRAVAQAVRARLRETDAVARIGGDEFAVLLLSAAPASGAVARKICATVRDVRVDVGGHALTTTASVGVAALGPDRADATALIAAADAAMYAAKAAGGDGVVSA